MGTQEPEFSSVEAGADAAVTLVVGLFTRAERLRRFMHAIEALPGIRETVILALQQGMLTLALEYTDSMPFLPRLQTLAEFPFEVEGHDERSITVRLLEPTDIPS